MLENRDQSYCEGRFSDDPDCVHGVRLPTLIEIIEPETRFMTFLFCFLCVSSWLAVYLGLYTCRTVLLLALVEEEKGNPTDLAKIHSDVDLLHDDGEDAELSINSSAYGLQERLLFSRPPVLERTALRRAMARCYVVYMEASRALYSFAWHMLFYPESQEYLLTRSVMTAIRQLRYWSNGLVFTVRAMWSYLLYWVFIPRAYAFLFALMVVALELLYKWMFKSPSKETFTWLVIAAVQAVYPISPCTAMSVNTLRILTQSFGTQITNQDLFRPSEGWRAELFPRDIDQKACFRIAYFWTHFLYGIFGTLPTVVYYLMIRSINVTGKYYSTEPDKRADNFLFANETRRNAILTATATWLALSVIRVFCLCLIFRVHSTFMSSKVPTIVDFKRGLPIPQKFGLAFWRLPEARVLRILRVCVQLALVLLGTIAYVSLGMLYLSRTLYNGGLFEDWLLRYVFEYNPYMTATGYFWNLTYWARQVIWALGLGWPLTKTDYVFSKGKVRPDIWP